MNSSNLLFLNESTYYDLGGKIVTLEEIRTAFIESSMYRELRNSMEGSL